LDGLGNWKKTNYEPVGGTLTTEQRQHNKLNQITRTKVDSTLTGFTYDKSGNLLNDGIRLYEYDAFNRLLKVYKDPNTTPVIVGTYSYDAGGRRIRKIVSNNGLTGTIPNGTTDCLYTGWRCIEERDGSNNPTKQMVWGIYIDELIQQKNIAALNNFAANAELYPLQDILYRTTGLADSTGVVREAYDCDAYGNTLIFRNTGSPPSAITFSDSDTQVHYPTCEFIFTGQRLDAETSAHWLKYRYYISRTGRFLTQDLLFSANLYLFCRSTPNKYKDPLGLIGATGLPPSLTNGFDPWTGKYIGIPNNPFIGPPNWGEESGSLNHTRHWMYICLDDSEDAVSARQKIYYDLKTFRHFNGGHNTVATVRISGATAFFDSLGFMGFMSDLINPSEVPVELSYNDSEREVSAQTLGFHMLVGVRKWRVDLFESAKDKPYMCNWVCCTKLIRIETESYDRARGWFNSQGMGLMGSEQQLAVWTAYLQNMHDAYRKQWKTRPWSCDDNISGYHEDLGSQVNPWRPSPKTITPQPRFGRGPGSGRGSTE